MPFDTWLFCCPLPPTLAKPRFFVLYGVSPYPAFGQSYFFYQWWSSSWIQSPVKTVVKNLARSSCFFWKSSLSSGSWGVRRVRRASSPRLLGILPEYSSWWRLVAGVSPQNRFLILYWSPNPNFVSFLAEFLSSPCFSGRPHPLRTHEPSL